MLENLQKHEIITVIPTEYFNVGKMAKCKLALDESVFSTLHRAGEGLIVTKVATKHNECQDMPEQIERLHMWL